MKKISIYPCLLMVSLLVLACHPKQSAISELEDLTEYVQQNHDDFSNEDWENFISEFEVAVENVNGYTEHYSREEQMHICKMIGVCYGCISKYAIKEWSSEMNEMISNTGALMNGYMEEIREEDLEDMFDFDIDLD